MKAAKQSNAFVKFIVSAAVIYLTLYLIYQFVVRRYTYYDQGFISTIVLSSEWVLKFLGLKTFTVLQNIDMQVVGIDGSSGVWVGSNCNAITLFALFSVFVLAYPGNQKHKIWFIPAGIVLIHFLNIARVVGLALVAFYSPAWLDFNHTYTFTFLIYAFIFFLWITWVNKFAVRSNHHASRA